MKSYAYAYASLLAAAATFLAGCATHRAKEKPMHEEGWIGGRYKCAKARRTAANWFSGGDHLLFDFPRQLESTQKSAIFVAELATNTPGYHAGIRAGDLILQVNGQPATDLTAFYDSIRAAHPGAALPCKIWRDGKIFDLTVRVGREKFRYRGTVAMGWDFPMPGMWEAPHPIPTREAPDFSLGLVGWERNTDSPVDFTSTKQRYTQSCHPGEKTSGDDQEWHCWLAIFDVSKGRTILGQEEVPAKN